MKDEGKKKKSLDPAAMLPEELGAVLEELGAPRFHGAQVFSWFHGRGVVDPGQMTDLSKSLRASLSSLDFSWPVEIGEVFKSSDGTRKIEIRLKDGFSVETVLIPEGDKTTQCVSTQVGCAVGCAFCRSGSLGLLRNLSAAEIVGQVQTVRFSLMGGQQPRNVVFMGIGEPLHNVAAVKRAIDLMAHPKGLDLSSRRITLSTVGTVRGLNRLAGMTDGGLALAVSLHASDDETRRALVPTVKDRLSDIVECLRGFPMAKRRRITIEYVLVKDVNDSKEAASRLARLLAPIKVKINLLPLNPHDRTTLLPPDEETSLRFQKTLVDKGLSVFLRKRRGDDIGAACGQLLATPR